MKTLLVCDSCREVAVEAAERDGGSWVDYYLLVSALRGCDGGSTARAWTALKIVSVVLVVALVALLVVTL